MNCDLCVRFEGDLHYKRHDLRDAARRLARRPSKKAQGEALAAQAALAETKRLYAEHVEREHEGEAA